MGWRGQRVSLVWGLVVLLLSRHFVSLSCKERG